MASNATSSFMEAAAYHFAENRPLIPMYMHLLLSALFPIYTGAHASLSRPSSAAKPVKSTSQEADDDDDEEEETVQKMEGLSPSDAIVFPITAGLVLAVLYWLIKKYGAGIINTVLGLYFSLIGTYSVAKLINDSWTTVAGVLLPAYYSDRGTIWKVRGNQREVVATAKEDSTRTRKSPFPGLLGRLPLPTPISESIWMARDLTTKNFQVAGYAKDLFDFKIIMTQHNVISALLGVAAITYSLSVSKPWWLTNLQGFAVSYGALQLMSPTTFATGTLILSGLFFYDIWAVFFTPLMVTVAKNLDVPIKLVFPRPDQAPSAPGEPAVRSYSMLGLGDIVLPGLMIALALRFDLYLHYLRKQKKVQKCEGDVCTFETEKSPYVTATGHWGDKIWTQWTKSSELPARLSNSFTKPYFTASVIGYIIGMLATLVFMSVFNHAQPALLYLVPGVLGSVWGTALVRGEVKEVWAYSEAITGEANDDEESEGESKPEEKLQSRGFFADLFGSSKTDEAKKGDGKKEGGSQGKPSSAAKSTSDPLSLFSLTIRHHQRKSGPSMPRGAGSGQDKDQNESTTSEGAILVSSADLDDAKSTQTRFRTVSTQQGTAEKYQRLS